MKYLYILVVAIVSCNSLFAQEITNIQFIPYQQPGEWNLPINLAKNMIENDGRYYFMLRDCGDRFRDAEFPIEIEYEDIVTQVDHPPLGDRDLLHSVLMEYVPGEGVADYTVINYNRRINDHAISVDGDHIAVCEIREELGFDDQYIYGDLEVYNPDVYTHRNIAVYDKLNDSLLWLYEDFKDDLTNYNVQVSIGLSDEHVYYATTFTDTVVFMGDTLSHLDDTVPFQYTTMLHKINWEANEKVWSKYIGAYSDEDRVRKIQIVDDGSIMLEIETNGPFTWDGVQYDPDHFIGSGNGIQGTYNIVVAKVNPEGEYLSHAHIKARGCSCFRNVQIDESGEVLAYGFVYGNDIVEIEEDTIYNEVDNFASGLLMSFDKDLKLKWHKKFIADYISVLRSANRMSNGDVVASLDFGKNVEIEGQNYDAVMFNDFDYLSNYFLHFDSTGVQRSTPQYYGVSRGARDIIELGPDHYLIFSDGQYNINTIPPFLGFDLNQNGDYNLIMEVKGELFETLTAVDNFLVSKNLNISPNPALGGTEVFLNLPFQNEGFIELQIFNNMGTMVSHDKLNSDYFDTRQLSIGLHHVIVKSNSGIFYTQLIIN